MKALTLVIALALSISAAAQRPANGSMLKPPKGANVALVVFEDLECPRCAQATPLLEQTASNYKIPLVIHDFPLRMHPWAMDAAVIARYIEQKYGRSASDAFRDYIYKSQPQITKANLRQFAESYCASHKIELPFAMDPQGEIAKLIRADVDLGTQTGLGETPTMFVVSTKDWRQVQDNAPSLSAAIEQLQAAYGAPKAVAPAKPKAKK